jgi:hypothetical protein
MGRRLNRCVPCAKRLPFEENEFADRHGNRRTWHSVNPAAFEVQRTGRTRPHPARRSTRRKFAATEWICKNCGRTWWSTHR